MTRDVDTWMREQRTRQPGKRRTLDAWQHDDTTNVETPATPSHLQAASITQGPRGRTPAPRPTGSEVFDEALRDRVFGGTGTGQFDPEHEHERR